MRGGDWRFVTSCCVLHPARPRLPGWRLQGRVKGRVARHGVGAPRAAVHLRLQPEVGGLLRLPGECSLLRGGFGSF